MSSIPSTFIPRYNPYFPTPLNARFLPPNTRPRTRMVSRQEPVDGGAPATCEVPNYTRALPSWCLHCCCIVLVPFSYPEHQCAMFRCSRLQSNRAPLRQSQPQYRARLVQRDPYSTQGRVNTGDEETRSPCRSMKLTVLWVALHFTHERETNKLWIHTH